MAVKVISDKPVKTYKVICPKCCYELEYTPIDVQTSSHRDYSGETENYYWIICPREVCKNKVYVSND